MLRRWLLFRELSTLEQQVLVCAMLLHPLFWLALRKLGLSRVQRWIERASIGETVNLAADQVAALGRVVNIAANHTLMPVSCLSRSLVLLWILRRHGIRAVLRIGVQLETGALVAHAWVEYGQRPVNDAPDIAERFKAFDKPPSALTFGKP